MNPCEFHDDGSVGSQGFGSPINLRDLNRALDMLELSLEGKTQKEIGKRYGISHGRVGQIVNYLIRVLLAPKRLAGDPVPPHESWHPNFRRQHAQFWRRQIAKARREAAL